MRSATRVTWLIGAIAIALAATSCGGGGDENKAHGNVVYAFWTDPQNPLEPANTTEVQGGKVLDMIFRGLKAYDPQTGKPELAAAQSITTKDQQTFTMTVKKGLKFSDGTPLTAKSFIDAWNYGALVTNKQLNAYFFSDIKGYDDVHPLEGAPKAKTMSGLKLIDDQTFTVTLKQKFSTWPDRLGYKAFAPLPQMFFDDHAGYLKKPVGNGPYRVESYKKGKEMKLVKNDGYTGADQAKNDGVLLKVYTDNNTAYTDLLSGNIDVIDDVPVAQLANVKTDLPGRYINQPAGIIQTIAFPFYQKAWQGKNGAKLRQGISMAIDRAAVTKQIFQDTRTPATDWTSPVLGDTGGYKEGLCGEYCQYNPTKAKQLIDEAGGIPGGKFTITTNLDTGSHKDWVDAVCNSINKVLGKENVCTLNGIGTFDDERNQITKHEMTGPFRAGWQMDYPLIDDFLTPLYKTGSSSNDGAYSNKEFDSLINQANAEPDTAKAVSLYQDAEKILVKDMPAIPLWYQNGSGAYSDRVSGVKLDAFSVPQYVDVVVKDK